MLDPRLLCRSWPTVLKYQYQYLVIGTVSYHQNALGECTPHLFVSLRQAAMTRAYLQSTGTVFQAGSDPPCSRLQLKWRTFCAAEGGGANSDTRAQVSTQRGGRRRTIMYVGGGESKWVSLIDLDIELEPRHGMLNAFFRYSCTFSGTVPRRQLPTTTGTSTESGTLCGTGTTKRRL